ncbi:hypothetical protein M1146_05795 [Patescibacteria group bacterium]|nr:hypothetical protein [Patescibacteria group bacterium]
MDYIRTIIIFAHLMVFAFAITTLYKSDLKLIYNRPKSNEIKSMGNHMLIYLIVLWLTGLGVIYIDTAFDFEKILSAQKLLTKLSCVLVLTINAFIIHFVAFKKLTKETLTKSDMIFMSISGAISTASWTFAGFLGIAKPLVKHLSLSNFLSLYALVVIGATAVAIALTPMITRNWNRKV